MEINLSWNDLKIVLQDKGLSLNYHKKGDYYIVLAFDGPVVYKCEIELEVPKSLEQEDFENNYKNLENTNTKFNGLVEVTNTVPFAKPEYRTKRSSNQEWITCSSNTVTNLDYLITEERYVSGGEIIYKDAKEGDYIVASIYDKDGVIPEHYRASLAENYPTVATYIEKKWIKPVVGYDSFLIDTYPLNARITAGLYLRVTYYSSNEFGDRKCVVNYHLTKKL